MQHVVTNFLWEIIVKKRKNENQLLRKLLVTAGILLVYLCGRQLPVYSIDKEWYRQTAAGAERFLGMTIGGDVYKMSVLALGISPYMIASILIMVVTSVRRATTRSKFSYAKSETALYILAFFLAVWQAIMTVSEMHFLPSALPLYAVQGIAAAELVAGAMGIVWLTCLNKEYGLGGQSVLIVVNILGSIAAMVSGSTVRTLVLPVLCALAAAAVTLVMENAELRIPVQRVFIRNLYKDENYIAIKYNPIGVMPVMFSTAIFLFLQQVLVAAQYLLRDVLPAGGQTESLKLTEPLGIAVYIAILYLFTVLFSLILIGPGEMSEQLAKSNDSLCNICAGRPTRIYLTRSVLRLSLVSATAMSLCVGASLVLELYGQVDAGMVMLPSMAMMLTGIAVNLWREFRTAVRFESYRVIL